MEALEKKKEKTECIGSCLYGRHRGKGAHVEEPGDAAGLPADRALLRGGGHGTARGVGPRGKGTMGVVGMIGVVYVVSNVEGAK